jgi:hypothetical protein
MSANGVQLAEEEFVFAEQSLNKETLLRYRV